MTFSKFNSLCFLMLFMAQTWAQNAPQISWSQEAYIWGGIGLSHLFVGWEFQKGYSPNYLLEKPSQSSGLNNWSRRQYSSRMDLGSDLLLWSLMATGPFLASPAFSSNTTACLWLSNMLTYGEALAFSSLLNLWVRSQSYSPRPLAYNPHAPFKERNKSEAMGSFYSGHSSAAFLSAVYFGNQSIKNYPQHKWPKFFYGGALGTACLVASMRMYAGKHYLADVTAGAVIGSLFAWAYPKIKYAGITPHLNPGEKEAGLSWRQTF